MSQLKRKRSSSCIPVSRLSARNSQACSSRLTTAQQSLDRKVSTSTGNLSEIPRFSRKNSGSLVRQTSCTPAHQLVRQRSFADSSSKKQSQLLFDKRWQFDQISKVRKYVAENFPQVDFNLIKSGMPLDLIVLLIHNYGQLIDKRNVITKENYVEQIPEFLKRYRYHSAVKPSFLKTISAPHSWPHLIAILSWLTDIVIELKVNEYYCPFEEKEKQIISRYLVKSYKIISTDNFKEDMALFKEELKEKLMDSSNINKDEIKKLSDELIQLQEQSLSIEQGNDELNKEIDNLNKEIKSVKENYGQFLTTYNSMKTNLQAHSDSYKQKIHELDQKLSLLMEENERLKQIIDAQPYSSKQLKDIKTETENLEHTYKLLKESYQIHQDVLSKSDLKLCQLRQKVQEENYTYNNNIAKLEVDWPEINELRIREHGYMKNDMKDEICRAMLLLDKKLEEIKQSNMSLDIKFNEAIAKDKKLSEELAMVLKEKENLIKTDAELTIIYAQERKKYEKEKEKITTQIMKVNQELTEIKENSLDVVDENELKELTEKVIKLINTKEELQRRAKNFFIKLGTQMVRNYKQYYGIVTKISKATEDACTKSTENLKNNIQLLKKVLSTLEEL